MRNYINFKTQTLNLKNMRLAYFIIYFFLTNNIFVHFHSAILVKLR